MKIKAVTMRYILTELRALDTKNMKGLDVIALGRVEQIIENNLRNHEARKLQPRT